VLDKPPADAFGDGASRDLNRVVASGTGVMTAFTTLSIAVNVYIGASVGLTVDSLTRAIVAADDVIYVYCESVGFNVTSYSNSGRTFIDGGRTMAVYLSFILEPAAYGSQTYHSCYAEFYRTGAANLWF